MEICGKEGCYTIRVICGIPFVVKDNVASKDKMETAAGSAVLIGTYDGADRCARPRASSDRGRRAPWEGRSVRIGVYASELLCRRLRRCSYQDAGAFYCCEQAAFRLSALVGEQGVHQEYIVLLSLHRQSLQNKQYFHKQYMHTRLLRAITTMG